MIQIRQVSGKIKVGIAKAIQLANNLIATLEQNDEVLHIYKQQSPFKLVFTLRDQQRILNIDYSFHTNLIVLITTNYIKLYTLCNNYSFKLVKIILRRKESTLLFNTWFFLHQNLIFINSYNMKFNDGIRIFNIFNSSEQTGFIQKNFQVKCYKIIDKNTIVFGILNAIMIYKLQNYLKPSQQDNTFEKIDLKFQDLQSQQQDQQQQQQEQRKQKLMNGQISVIESLDRDNYLLGCMRCIYIFNNKQKVVHKIIQQYHHPADIQQLSVINSNQVISCCLSGLAVKCNIFDSSQKECQIEDLNMSQKDCIVILKKQQIYVIKKKFN